MLLALALALVTTGPETPPLWGTSDPDPEISLGGLETQVADLRVVLAALAAEPFVDIAQLGLIGVGFNASAALSLQLRHQGVRSLVSLDGGIPTPFEDRFLQRTPYFDLAAVRVPILAAHSPHETIDTSLWNQYRYADRRLLHFPAMTEFHFLSFGPRGMCATSSRGPFSTIRPASASSAPRRRRTAPPPIWSWPSGRTRSPPRRRFPKRSASSWRAASTAWRAWWTRSGCATLCR